MQEDDTLRSTPKKMAPRPHVHVGARAHHPPAAAGHGSRLAAFLVRTVHMPRRRTAGLRRKTAGRGGRASPSKGGRARAGQSRLGHVPEEQRTCMRKQQVTHACGIPPTPAPMLSGGGVGGRGGGKSVVEHRLSGGQEGLRGVAFRHSRRGRCFNEGCWRRETPLMGVGGCVHPPWSRAPVCRRRL